MFRWLDRTALPYGRLPVGKGHEPAGFTSRLAAGAFSADLAGFLVAAALVAVLLAFLAVAMVAAPYV